MNHRDQAHGGIDKYNILFCTNINRHESPVRDYQQQPLFKKEEQYKDYYGVSNFKFPEVTTVSRTNHANFCELSFDGTKSTKHHHRRNNTIKRVTSATTINCTADRKEKQNLNEKVKEEKEEEVATNKIIGKNNKDTITFHHLAEQFKKKLKFIETPVKLQKNVVAKQKGSTFEVILSPKTPTSYSSIETMSNMLQSSEHRHKQIIVTSKTFRPPPNKPDMRDREIQTAIIGIRNINNLDECFNVSLASVNDIFYNMDHLLPHNEDLFNLKRRKRRELNLTVTHLPCVEIKCSSILFEMPAANAHRPQMPRRTINTDNNSIIEDYHEASNTDGKLSEPVTANSGCSFEAATDNLKDKIFNLFTDTQIAASQDFNKKVNDLCALIGNLVTENKSKHEKCIKKSVKIPSEMFINIKKVKTGDGNRKNALYIPSYSSPKTFHKNSLHQKSSSNPSTPQRSRSRSVSPPSRPSTPSCQISKIPVVDSVNQMNVVVTTSPRSDSNESRLKKKNIDANRSKFSFTSIPSVSTMSSGSRHIQMVFDDDTDGTQTSQQVERTVPRNVFVIPPHVNEILKKSEYNTASTLKKVFGEGRKSPPATSNNVKLPNECHLINILKKSPIKQSWVVPDFVSKSQPKCDAINSFQCTKHTKNSKRTDHDFSGPSVTFNSMVDVFGGDNESLEAGVCLTPDPKALQNTIVPVTSLKKPKTNSNKPEFHATNDRQEEETNHQNCGLNVVTARQTENRPKPIFEKQASFYNSGLLSPKKEANATSCLQKRKDYDHKLKMQLQMQNKQSKIPLPVKVVILENNAVKVNKSKLPLKVTNEVINNKQVICSSNAQEFSKLFTTDIKDTPFFKLKSDENTPRKQESQLRPTVSILKNTQKNIEKILNINKDVTQ